MGTVRGSAAFWCWRFAFQKAEPISAITAKLQLQLHSSSIHHQPHPSSTCCLETRSKGSNVDRVPPCSRRSVRRLARRNHGAPANNHAYSNIRSLILATPGRNPLRAEEKRKRPSLSTPGRPSISTQWAVLRPLPTRPPSPPTRHMWIALHSGFCYSCLELPQRSRISSNPSPAANHSPAHWLPPCSLTVPAYVASPTRGPSICFPYRCRKLVDAGHKLMAPPIGLEVLATWLPAPCPLS